MTRFGIFSAIVFLGLGNGIVRAEIPTTELYPFAGFDLDAVRAKTKAEWSPDTPDLSEAWRLYREIQGSWMPGAAKPSAKAIARLDELKGQLEALPKPAWFSDVLKSPQSSQSGQSHLAEKIGDEEFQKQKAVPDYQSLKALTLVYLSEHELDRPESADLASRYLVVLSITHPWDWQIHGLYSRLLVDARLPAPAWEAAKQGLFLNPGPTLGDLEFFAFIGSIVAREHWPEIQKAMKQAAIDGKSADLAIEHTAKYYSAAAKVNVIPPKP